MNVAVPGRVTVKRPFESLPAYDFTGSMWMPRLSGRWSVMTMMLPCSFFGKKLRSKLDPLATFLGNFSAEFDQRSHATESSQRNVNPPLPSAPVLYDGLP